MADNANEKAAHSLIAKKQLILGYLILHYVYKQRCHCMIDYAKKNQKNTAANIFLHNNHQTSCTVIYCYTVKI